MKSQTISDLQKELALQPPKKLQEICVRLAKYKNENKELLTYLLFDSNDEATFIESVKAETDQYFVEMNRSNLYLAKKSLRKILRNITKQCRYSGKKETEIELIHYFCMKLRASGIPYKNSPVLVNLYVNQVKKIEKAISKLHEDLRFDYAPLLAQLAN